jgi:hypothetical protein
MFTVRLDPGASMTGVRPILYFSRNGTVSERALQAVPVDGKGRVVVAIIPLFSSKAEGSRGHRTGKRPSAAGATCTSNSGP